MARLSADGAHRYLLMREWSDGPRSVAWMMLNPSTADHERDDPTIRRCITFSIDRGFDRMFVVNLFAFRSTDPQVLVRLGSRDQAIGPQNDAFILSTLKHAEALIVGWGSTINARRRAGLVLAKIRSAWPGLPIKCLGITMEADPRHPLYVPRTFPLIDFPFQPFIDLVDGPTGQPQGPAA